MALADPPTSSIQPSRKDTLALKRKLAESISDASIEKAYWNLLTQFLLGRLAKVDLDRQLNELLSEDTAIIHNQLLLAILHNAQKGIPPPPSTQSAPSSTNPSIASSPRIGNHESTVKQKKDELLTKDDLKRRQASRLVASLNHEDRKRLKALNDLHNLNSKKIQNQHNDTWAAPEIQSWLRAPESKDPVQSCVDEFDLPALDTLQGRMDFHAKQYGLVQGASPEGAEFLSHALDNFIKDLVARTVSKVQSTRASPYSHSINEISPPPLKNSSDIMSIASSSLEDPIISTSPTRKSNRRKPNVIISSTSPSTPTLQPDVVYETSTLLDSNISGHQESSPSLNKHIPSSVPSENSAGLNNYQFRSRSPSRSKSPKSTILSINNNSSTFKNSSGIHHHKRILNNSQFINSTSKLLYNRPKHIALLDLAFASEVEPRLTSRTEQALEIRENILARLEDFEDVDDLLSK